MCVGDWRIGRLIRSHYLGSIVGTTGVINIPQNSQRVGLAISCISGTGITAPIAQLTTPDQQQVFTQITSFNGNLLLTIKDWGDLPTRSLILVCLGTGSDTFTATEFIMPESYLAAGLEEFMRTYPGNP